jgi:hypothetical protein
MNSYFFIWGFHGVLIVVVVVVVVVFCQKGDDKVHCRH